MTKDKRKHIFLTASFAVIIFSASLSRIGIELSRGRRPLFAELFLQKPTKTNIRAFEKELEDTSWFSQKLRPWMQYLRFMVLNDTGDKVLMGRDGWLFYKPAVQYLTEPWPADVSAAPRRQQAEAGGDKGDCFSAILSFRDQLAARGIQLLVVPVPNKASVYPEKLTSRTKRPVNPHTLEIISELTKAGIEVVNLFEVFSHSPAGNKLGRAPAAQATDDDTSIEHRASAVRRPAEGIEHRAPRYYLPQDTHWSPEGMRLAAKTTGQRILALGWAEKGEVEYDLKPVTIKRYGDVLQMMEVPQIERRFAPEQIHCTQVINADNGQPYQDDPDSEILVLGDSFLRVYEQDEPGSAGFIAHLARELGFSLTSIVNDGGASTLVRQQLSRKPALLADKKLVIWEFVERDIRFGTEGWQKISLHRY